MSSNNELWKKRATLPNTSADDDKSLDNDVIFLGVHKPTVDNEVVCLGVRIPPDDDEVKFWGLENHQQLLLILMRGLYHHQQPLQHMQVLLILVLVVLPILVRLQWTVMDQTLVLLIDVLINYLT